MEAYQQRVIEEHKELRIRLNKLNEFIGSEMFNNLETDQKTLLTEQAVAMNEYSGILAQRINAFGLDSLKIPNPFDFDGPEMKSTEQVREQEIIADKTLRKNLDVDLQNIKACPRSRERSLAINKLQEAIMWLGMDLKRLNEPNPYPDSYNSSNTKIAPTADGLKL